MSKPWAHAHDPAHRPTTKHARWPSCNSINGTARSTASTVLRFCCPPVASPGHAHDVAHPVAHGAYVASGHGAALRGQVQRRALLQGEAAPVQPRRVARNEEAVQQPHAQLRRAAARHDGCPAALRGAAVQRGLGGGAVEGEARGGVDPAAVQARSASAERYVTVCSGRASKGVPRARDKEG
jgi:hypothetical protein